MYSIVLNGPRVRETYLHTHTSVHSSVCVGGVVVWVWPGRDGASSVSCVIAYGCVCVCVSLRASSATFAYSATFYIITPTIVSAPVS